MKYCLHSPHFMFPLWLLLLELFLALKLALEACIKTLIHANIHISKQT